jgi:hypothetical protein
MELDDNASDESGKGAVTIAGRPAQETCSTASLCMLGLSVTPAASPEVSGTLLEPTGRFCVPLRPP